MDAAGRALDGQWDRNGGVMEIVVILLFAEVNGWGLFVEDCASACSVAGYLTGIALLGTSLLESHIPTLRTYDRLVVALDKDATKKALDLVRRLQAHRPTSLVILDKDVKNMEEDERNDFLRSHINR